MATARPLRDVFAAATGVDAAGSDPGELLRSNGHDLPDELVAEAVVGYADTAPIEVAEHLAGYVAAHSAVPLNDLPEVDPAGWLDDLASAPITLADHPDADFTVVDFAGAHFSGPDFGGPDPADLDFGDAAASGYTTDSASGSARELADSASDHDDRADDGDDHDAAQARFGIGHPLASGPLADQSLADPPAGLGEVEDVHAGSLPHSTVDPIADPLLSDEQFDDGDSVDGFDDDPVDS